MLSTMMNRKQSVKTNVFGGSGRLEMVKAGVGSACGYCRTTKASVAAFGKAAEMAGRCVAHLGSGFGSKKPEQ